MICIKFRYGVLFSLTLFFSFGFKSYTNIVPKKTSSSVVHESFLFFFESLVSRFTHHSIMSYLKNDQWPHCNNCASTVFSLLFISNLSIFAILLWPIKKKEHNRVVQQANFRCHFIWLPSTEEAQLINNRFSTRSSYSIHHFFLCVYLSFCCFCYYSLHVCHFFGGYLSLYARQINKNKLPIIISLCYFRWSWSGKCARHV